ncbi:hypothetical protein [Mariniphaga sediminis]|nr:hypothetical protein [Mariniphaga sediminis]
MNYDNVVEKFLYLAAQDYRYTENNSEIINNCVDIQFGYFDLTTGISCSGENFTKSWKMKQTNNYFSSAYINDKNSETISYDNDIQYKKC